MDVLDLRLANTLVVMISAAAQRKRAMRIGKQRHHGMGAPQILLEFHLDVAQRNRSINMEQMTVFSTEFVLPIGVS